MSHTPMTLQEIYDAWMALIHTGDDSGFARVLDGIRAGEISVESTEEGTMLRVVEPPGFTGEASGPTGEPGPPGPPA